MSRSKPDPEARCAELLALFATAPIKKTFGLEFSYADDHSAVFDLPANPGLTHALGDTHGGVIATLLDNAGWFTAAVAYESWVATTDLQMRLLELPRQEPLRATARLIRAGTKLAVTEMQVRTASGRLIATGSATFFVTSASTAV